MHAISQSIDQAWLTSSFFLLKMHVTNKQQHAVTHALELCAHVLMQDTYNGACEHNFLLEIMQACKQKINNLLYADKAFSNWMYSPEAEN